MFRHLVAFLMSRGGATYQFVFIIFVSSIYSDKIELILLNFINFINFFLILV